MGEPWTTFAERILLANIIFTLFIAEKLDAIHFQSTWISLMIFIMSICFIVLFIQSIFSKKEKPIGRKRNNIKR